VKLLDSNTVIHYLRGSESVAFRLRQTDKRQLGIPGVVAYEIEYGTLKSGSSRRRAFWSDLLADLVHVPFDNEAAVEAAGVRVELERQGSVIGPIDLLVAGTALSRGAVLVTNNTKEFSRVKGLRLEDWTRPLNGHERS
jgi:tRNA(fMet)-specific endonuclease VapC